MEASSGSSSLYNISYSLEKSKSPQMIFYMVLQKEVKIERITSRTKQYLTLSLRFV